MSWGHGAVQRALLAELQKQQQAIDTMSLLRIICDGDNPTHAQGQSGRRALRPSGSGTREPQQPSAASWPQQPSRMTGFAAPAPRAATPPPVAALAASA